VDRVLVEVVVLDDLLPGRDRGFEHFAGMGAFRDVRVAEFVCLDAVERPAPVFGLRGGVDGERAPSSIQLVMPPSILISIVPASSSSATT
jgi:hypothetical protein